MKFHFLLKILAKDFVYIYKKKIYIYKNKIYIYINLTKIIFNFLIFKVKELVFQVEEINFPPKQRIFKKNEITDKSLYIIRSGEIGLNLNEDNRFETNEMIRKLGNGNIFGEYSFFTGNAREINATALDFCSLLKINFENFQKILKIFPNDHEIYSELKDKMTFTKDYSPINLK